MSPIENFLREVNQTRSRTPKDQITELTRILSIDPEVNLYVADINRINHSIDTNGIETEYDSDWPAFNSVVCSFIKLSHELEPWSLLKSFDLYTSYLNDLSIAFNNTNYGWLLSNIIKEASDMIIPWAIKLDLQLYYQEQGGRYRLNYLASILLKMFNNIRSQINDINTYKRSIILYLGNKLCLIYFKIDNPLLCRNIFSNMNNTSLHLRDFVLKEQLQYRYYLGKFYFIKYQLMDSFRHLSWCLYNCRIQDSKNIKLILEFLLPVCLVIGKMPNFNYVKQICNQSWVLLYERLAGYMKSGDLALFELEVQQNYQYFKDQNVLLLMTKARVVVIRNLVKHVWKILGRVSNLDYECIRLTVPGANDDYLVENVLITLIDQNLVKGKIFTRLRKVALSKNEPFPNVYDIYNLKFPARKDNEWM